MSPVTAGLEIPDWLDTELSEGGFAELVVSPRAEIIGHPIRAFGLRKTWEVEPILLLSRGELHEGDFSDVPLQAGDTISVSD